MSSDFGKFLEISSKLISETLPSLSRITIPSSFVILVYELSSVFSVVTVLSLPPIEVPKLPAVLPALLGGVVSKPVISVDFDADVPAVAPVEDFEGAILLAEILTPSSLSASSSAFVMLCSNVSYEKISFSSA